MEFQDIVAAVAKRNHTTPEYVYAGMQSAIEQAFRNRNSTAQARRSWRALGFGAQCPTPEQFIGQLAARSGQRLVV